MFSLDMWCPATWDALLSMAGLCRCIHQPTLVGCMSDYIQKCEKKRGGFKFE